MEVEVEERNIMRERIQLVVKREKKNLSVHHLVEEEVVVEVVEEDQDHTDEEVVGDLMVEVMVDEVEVEEVEEEEVEVKVEGPVVAVTHPVEIESKNH